MVPLYVMALLGLNPKKTKHSVTKLNLTILLLSPWYIDIHLSIHPMSLTLYMT